jgi:heat shock protein HslJ
MQFRRPVASLFALFAVAAAGLPATASEPFPFDSELMLDAAPMHGSKRVPMLEIDDNGAASIDLWCTSLRGQATVGDDSIAIVPGDAPAAPAPDVACEPDRQATDAALLAALTQATKWRRVGDVVELSGITTLRYRLLSN